MRAICNMQEPIHKGNFLKQFKASIRAHHNLLALLAYRGKDIVFRFIIEYNSLMDFGPNVIIGLFLYEDFWKMIFWLVLKLEIN